MQDLDLSDLAAFTAVARARSFRGAAILRSVSASSLSEALRRLEARLGVRLLNRTTRSVTLTEAGQRLLERLEPALLEISTAIDAVNDFRETPLGTLRLNVPTIVARHVLPRVAGPFLHAHPGIVLEIIAEDSFIDVFAAGFDAGIRYDERLERDMVRVPLGPRVQHYITAAAPDYLQRKGRPAHPRDLLDHACIRHRFESGNTPRWEFIRDKESLTIAPVGQLVATSLDLEVAAAVQGLGVIRSFREELEPCLARGELESILPEWEESFSGPYLYYPTRRLMPAPLRAFVDFLRGPLGRW